MRHALWGLPVVVLVIVGLLMVTPFLATCGGADDAVTALVQRCDCARAFLGTDAHPARMGLACGSTEVSGASGSASWTLPYTGDANRGTVTFQAVKQAGEWHVVAATLGTDGEAIDLVACAGGVVTPLQRLDGTFDGPVTASTHEQVTVGMVCSGTIARAAGETLADVVVTCADSRAASEGTVVYRGRSEVTADLGASAQGDEKLHYSDTKGPVNATLEVDGATGSLRVWSQSPAWEIRATL